MHSTPSVVAQQLRGCAHLLACLFRADATHDADRLPIVDVDRLQELMGVGVLLQVEQRILGDGLKLRYPALERLADDEERGRNPEAIVERPRLLEEVRRHLAIAAPLDVVADQECAHVALGVVSSALCQCASALC